MPPLVVEGVCRFALHGTNGRPWVNIFDFHLDTAGGGARADAIQDQAEIINQEWVSAWLSFVAATCHFIKTSWVDLDSLSGSTGETTETSGSLVLETQGTASGEAVPPNVAYLVHKRAGGGRGTRDGRFFVPGVPEGMSSHDSVPASPLASINAMLPALLANLNQNATIITGGSYDSSLVVVRAPVGGETSFDTVTALELDSQFATQRRRLRA